MLADFYITRLSNDMKIAGQQNHLVGQILYRTKFGYPPIEFFTIIGIRHCIFLKLEFFKKTSFSNI